MNKMSKHEKWMFADQQQGEEMVHIERQKTSATFEGKHRTSNESPLQPCLFHLVLFIF